MKIHYIACARSSAVDGKTNQLSLFHVLDEIAAPAFPMQLPAICVAALFEREPEDAAQQSYALVVKLDGGLLASFTMTIDFAVSRRNRSVNTIQGLSIPGPGLVTISMIQKGKLLAEWRAVALQTGLTDPAPAAAPAKAAEAPAPGKGAAALN